MVVDKECLVLRVDGYAFAECVEVLGDNVLAYPHEVLVEYIPVIGVIEVHYRPLVIKGELQCGNDGTLYAVEGVVGAYKAIRLFEDYLLDKSREIRIVVIEGIPVNSALGHDILDRDLRQRPLFKKLQKCILYYYVL